MDRLGAMRIFVAVVEAQGFSAAARALRVPIPTVSRKVAELESHLGVQLLVRSTRKVRVTESGQRYYEDARRILDEIENVERQLSGEYQRPTGRLAITAPRLFGRLHVLPIANRFMRQHPEISIRMVLTNSVLNYLEENIDLGVRIGPLSDSSMVAVEIGTVRQIICASPGYLSEHGRPLSPDDLARHQRVSYSWSGEVSDWPFKMASGKIRRFPVQARSTLNSVEAIVDWAVQDGGVALMYAYQAAHHIADGALEIVLSDYEVEPLPVSFVYPQGGPLPQKVRAFIDYAMSRLRERLADIEKQCST